MSRKIYAKGSEFPEVIVICDVPSKGAYCKGEVMSKGELHAVSSQLQKQGYEPDQVSFIIPCPPIPEDASGSVKRNTEFMYLHRDEFLDNLQKFARPSLIICLGANAVRQLTKRACKITKARGIIDEYKGIPMLPVYSPSMVLRRPEYKDTFESDFRLAGTLRENGYSLEVFEHEIREGNYEWVTDLQFLIDEPPKRLVVDVETVGARWMDGRDGCPLVTVQLCWKKGMAVSVPMMPSYVADRLQELQNKLNNLDDSKPDYEDRRQELLGLIAEAPDNIEDEDVDRLTQQLRTILGNPETLVCGHNLKFDIHALRNYEIEVANWSDDTMQLAFVVDDNMEQKSLNDCVQRWVPEMAGYAHAFDAETDKSRMDLVPLDKMLHYGCGDVDATFRLWRVLSEEGASDSRNWRTYRLVQMPGLRAFVDVEEEGWHIDKDALLNLNVALSEQERLLYKKLISSVPNKIKRKHLEDPKLKNKKPRQRLSFTRDAFVQDILFSADGLNLEPEVFTASTQNLKPVKDPVTGEEVDQRIPSTGKDHLIYFEDIEFVRDLMEYSKLQKMRTTYVGSPSREEFTPLKPIAKGSRWPSRVMDVLDESLIPDPVELGRTRRRVRLRNRTEVENQEEQQPIFELVAEVPFTKEKDLVVTADGRLMTRIVTEPKGFWQYLAEGRDDLHPSFLLHSTVTGRSSSRNPNGQNIPKRGELAKAYRKVFKPKPGWLFVSCDLSQIELRLAAWMSGDPTMLEIYNQGGDIHEATAAAVLGISQEEFQSMRGDSNPYQFSRFKIRSSVSDWNEFYELRRFQAKAVNFGYVYGQWFTGLKVYAKTMGIDMTLDEAQAAREAFFEKFPMLDRWHYNTKQFVEKHGYVRSLHGAIRRLPSYHSNDESVQAEAKRQGINSPVQRLGSDLGVIGLTRFNRDAPRDTCSITGFIHDDIIAQFDPTKVEAEEVASYLKFYMESIPLEKWFGITPPLPIIADPSGPGENLADMPDMDGIHAQAPDWFNPDLD